MSKASSEDKVSARGRIDRKKNRILVVTDDKIILQSFRRILEMEGLIVDTAETGKQTLEKVSKRPFHLVVVDGTPPDMSGGDLKKKVSEIASHTRVLGLGMNLIDPKKLLEIVKAAIRSI